MIYKGVEWGKPEAVPRDALFVAGDAEASQAVSSAWRVGRPAPPLCLIGGDLARTLGAVNNEARLRAGRGTQLKIDVGEVLLDGLLFRFLAHLVARRSWWSGRVLVAANAAFIGDLNVAPKAHPGDGLLDVLDANPSFAQRLKIWPRLRTGSHLPHPQIATRRCQATQIEFSKPTPVALDGIDCGKAKHLSIRVNPASVDVWV